MNKDMAATRQSGALFAFFMAFVLMSAVTWIAFFVPGLKSILLRLQTSVNSFFASSPLFGISLSAAILVAYFSAHYINPPRIDDLGGIYTSNIVNIWIIFLGFMVVFMVGNSVISMFASGK